MAERPDPIAEGIELDLDAALERTYERHRVLLHTRQLRRRWATGALVGALVIGGILTIPGLGSEDGSLRFAGTGESSTTTTGVVTTSSSVASTVAASTEVPSTMVEPVPSATVTVEEGGGTTVTPKPTVTVVITDPLPEPPVPQGFTLSFEGDTRVLTRDQETLPPIPTSSNETAAVGSGVSIVRPVEVARVTPGPVWRSLTVDFVCTGRSDELLEVRYRQYGDSRLVVQAMVESGRPGLTCSEGAAGPRIVLPLAAPLAGNAEVVAQFTD